jgi:hypothetical protein
MEACILTNEERDEYIRKTHDTVIKMEERLQNHLDNKQVHQLPPCETAKKLEERNWKMVILALLSSISGIGALVMFIFSKWN